MPRPRLKILHVIPSLSPTQGGPSFALPLMARSLVRAGVTVDIATTDDDGPGARLSVPLGERIERDGSGVFHFRKQTEFYKVSLPFRAWLRRHVRDYHLVHIHALFSFTSSCAAHVARRAGVPYVIRPLGVLNRWGMENRRRLLKALSFRFLEQPILRHAAAMHYTARAEQAEAELCGATAPAAVIPLGLELAEFAVLPSPELFLRRCPQAVGRTVVLFLSRMDPKKGLDLLLPAFAQVKQRHPQALLVIAGSGREDYVRSLQQEATRLGLADDVVWPGFLAGADKLSALSAASVFVLPSYSENFGIALVEALAAGVACLTTNGVAVSEDLRAHEAGLVVAPEVAPLAAALDRLLGDAALRARLGASGRRLAQERFSIQVMGGRLKMLYETMLAETHNG